MLKLVVHILTTVLCFRFYSSRESAKIAVSYDVRLHENVTAREL
jgi:hypothetical protein